MQVEYYDASPSGSRIELKIAGGSIIVTFEILEWGGEFGETPVRWEEPGGVASRYKLGASRQSGYDGELDVIIDDDVIKYLMAIAQEKRSEYLLQDFRNAGDRSRADRLKRAILKRSRKRSDRNKEKRKASRPVHKNQERMDL